MIKLTETSFDRGSRKVGGSDLLLRDVGGGGRYFVGDVATVHGFVTVRQGRPMSSEGWTQLHFIWRGRIHERRFNYNCTPRMIVARARAFANEVRHAK